MDMSTATHRYLKQTYQSITGLNLKMECNHRKPKRLRSAFTTEQVQMLEEQFQRHPYIENGKRKEISQKLNITERAVKIWFQNRRMKAKKDAKEIVYESEKTENINPITDVTPSLNNNEKRLQVPYSECQDLKLTSSSLPTISEDSNNVQPIPNLEKAVTSCHISKTKHTEKILNSDLKSKPRQNLHTNQKLVGKICPTIYRNEEKTFQHSISSAKVNNQRFIRDKTCTQTKLADKAARLKGNRLFTHAPVPRYFGAAYMPRNIAWKPVNAWKPFVLKPPMPSTSHHVMRFNQHINNPSTCFCTECKLMTAYAQRRIVSVPYIVTVPYSRASPKM